MIWNMLRMFFVWYLIRQFFGGNTTNKLPREELVVPRFEKGFVFDMTVYLSESPSYNLSRSAKNQI